MKKISMTILLINSLAMAGQIKYQDLFFDGVRSAEGSDSNLDKKMLKKAKSICPQLNEAIKSKTNKIDALVEWDLEQCQKFHQEIKMNPEDCSSQKNNLARVFVRSSLTKACGIK